ncbi:hypothetical protein COCON_G00001260 [Conger conger]|uniref:Uncharacterized protein n=1 Tax=Conger conger TaxID=82655 RepID=A0A9Q1E0P0_CONCO|nr:hypothetical protein COCON_G00001260 [Conger conger]
MSLHRSMGDLVPQDIAEILARERHGVKGRKHRGGSLGRAFRWLKARRKKKRAAGGSTNGMAGLSADGRAGKHSHQHGHDIAKATWANKRPATPVLGHALLRRPISRARDGAGVRATLGAVQANSISPVLRWE